jgi:hypothetical protein
VRVEERVMLSILSGLHDNIWFVFAAIFGVNLALSPLLMRVADADARRRARRGAFVLGGAGVLLCLSFGILTRLARSDVVEAAWSGHLAHPLARVALGIWLLFICAFVAYVFWLGGDADMAAMSAHQAYGLRIRTPRGVRFFVAVLLLLLAVAFVLFACLS